ncbi:MAG: lytic transglycosylase domain-containing protein [Clostridiales bacterium]|nr:lytic transglycosylase domain-containing protein [Clostridiales bacterium]
MKKKSRLVWLIVPIVLLFAAAVSLFAVKSAFRRPYRDTVENFTLDRNLVYAVMKSESGFREDALSRAGAVGLMQIKPSTAEFICQRDDIPFDAEKLSQGEYNTELGCRYLLYLLERFPVCETAVAAYNAGEGTVSGWLKNAEYSADGRTLKRIPYPETERYVKKVIKFRKIYSFFDRKT